MLNRHKTEENKKEAETAYKLRQQGYTYQYIAECMGQHLQTAMQKCKRECRFREQSFHYPFIEYISGHTEKVIRRSLGENMLAYPEKLNDPEAIRAVLCWPGVGDATLQDLAEGLVEAGFESFIPGQIKESLFVTKKQVRVLTEY